jgi:ferric-dicitrate binding protein FerR (iron transport regulator)
MTSLSCFRAAALIDRRAAGLDEGDRLLLEEHLESCDRCAQDGRALARAAALSAGSRWPLSERERSRAIEGVLERACKPEAEPIRRAETRSWRPVMLAAAAAVAIVVALGSLSWRSDGPKAALAAPMGSSLHGAANLKDQLLGGGLSADDVEVMPGRGWAEGARLSTKGGARLWLAHGLVRLAPGTEARWDGTTATLSLLRGRVEAAVDASVGRRFAVSTPDFEVEVVGTHFAVGPTAVEVFRGRVRVLDLPSGETLIELGAGQHWSHDPSEPSVAASAPANPATGSASPAILLAQARTLLARGRVTDARHAVTAALGRPVSPAVEAEARSLMAECAMLSGDDAEAARRYAEVAGKFPGLPAGETALYAAARAQQKAGQRATARASLRKYLSRYPNGRFAAEARRRLATLSSKGQSP